MTFECKCGDTVTSGLDDRVRTVRDSGRECSEALRALMRTRCLACAWELNTGDIAPAGTVQADVGGGRRVIRSSKPFS